MERASMRQSPNSKPPALRRSSGDAIRVPGAARENLGRLDRISFRHDIQHKRSPASERVRPHAIAGSVVVMLPDGASSIPLPKHGGE